MDLFFDFVLPAVALVLWGVARLVVTPLAFVVIGITKVLPPLGFDPACLVRSSEMKSDENVNEKTHGCVNPRWIRYGQNQRRFLCDCKCPKQEEREAILRERKAAFSDREKRLSDSLERLRLELADREAKLDQSSKLFEQRRARALRPFIAEERQLRDEQTFTMQKRIDKLVSQLNDSEKAREYQIAELKTAHERKAAELERAHERRVAEIECAHGCRIDEIESEHQDQEEILHARIDELKRHMITKLETRGKRTRFRRKVELAMQDEALLLECIDERGIEIEVKNLHLESEVAMSQSIIAGLREKIEQTMEQYNELLEISSRREQELEQLRQEQQQVQAAAQRHGWGESYDRDGDCPIRGNDDDPEISLVAANNEIKRLKALYIAEITRSSTEQPKLCDENGYLRTANATLETECNGLEAEPAANSIACDIDLMLDIQEEGKRRFWYDGTDLAKHGRSTQQQQPSESCDGSLESELSSEESEL